MQRFGQGIGLFMGTTMQHPAPDSYSGQWLRLLPSESRRNPCSIDRNDRAGSTPFSRFLPREPSCWEINRRAAADFLSPQKKILIVFRTASLRRAPMIMSAQDARGPMS
jgi:hypothetical protein